MEDQTDYNIVTLKNVDDEDFIFAVSKVQYIIPAGQTRNFPKFMATLGMKHLIDKILQKEDPEGKTLRNQKERDRVGASIFITESTFEQPKVPTTAEIVEEINRPSDMERVLLRNKKALKEQETPVAVTAKDKIIPSPPIDVGESGVTAGTPIVEEEFDGSEIDNASEPDEEPVETEIPTRAKMMDYAKNTMKMNVEHPMMKKRLAKLSDSELYDELQMGV